MFLEDGLLILILSSKDSRVDSAKGLFWLSLSQLSLHRAQLDFLIAYLHSKMGQPCLVALELDHIEK